MRISLYLAVILVFVSNVSNGQNYNKSENAPIVLSYKLDYKIKHLLRNDTSGYTVKVLVGENDTGAIIYKLENTKNTAFTYYYVNDTTYYVNNKDNTYYAYRKKTGKRYVSPVVNLYNNIFLGNDYKYWLNRDTLNVVKDTGEIPYRAKYVIKNNKLKYLKREIEYFTQTQYEEFHFFDYKYLNYDIEKELLAIKQMNNKKELEKQKTNKPKNKLKVKGTLIHTSSYNTSAYELVLYEYWYKSCLPCIMSIPELNKLQEKYKNKLKVVGVNPVDKDTADLQKLIKRYKIDYDVLITKEDTQNNIYPLYILTNNKGNVIYETEGYSKEHFNTLDSLININL